MNTSDVAQHVSAISRIRIMLWAKIACAFVGAGFIQILFYGAPAVFGFGGYHVSGRWYLPVVLGVFFAPALGAAMFSLYQLVTFYRRSGSHVSVLAVAVVVLLALMSAYMGVFVSLNSWGT